MSIIIYSFWLRGIVIMGLLRLKEMQQDLSQKEFVVASWILDHVEEMKTISIHTLAKKVSVSTATILRLCTKLGYKGFSDFKVGLISAKNIKQISSVIQEDITLNDTPEEIVDKIFQIEKLAIEATYSMLDMGALNKAIELIDKSNKILIYGSGSSGLIAKELEYQLIKIKKNIGCDFDYNIQYNILGTLDEKDLLIILSNSGETSFCIKLLEYSKRLKVPSIAITRMGNSKVASLADVVLNTSYGEDSSRLIPVRSKVSQLSIINILVANIFIRKYEEHFELLNAVISSPTYLKTEK